MCGSSGNQTTQQAAPQDIIYDRGTSGGDKNRQFLSPTAPNATQYTETPDPIDPNAVIPQDQLNQDVQVPGITMEEARGNVALPSALEYFSDQELEDRDRINELEAIANQDSSGAARQARYKEDERVKGFRGFGSTILTGGQGVTSTANSRQLSLIGS